MNAGGFRSRLEVATLAGMANRCELAFRGAGLNNARFPDAAGVTKDGFRRAAFELPPDENAEHP